MSNLIESRFVERIRELLRELDSSPLDRSFVAEFLIEIRQLLEDSGTKETYQRVNLYCNWVAHADLSESMSILSILEHSSSLTQALTSGRATADNFGGYWEVSLGLDYFRLELTALLTAAKLPTDFFKKDSNWSRFIGFLLKKLEGKPLKLPPGHDQPPAEREKSFLKKARKSYDKALLLNNGNKNTTIVELKIILIKDDFDPRPPLFVEPTFHIQARSAFDTYYIVQMPSAVVPK